MSKFEESLSHPCYFFTDLIHVNKSNDMNSILLKELSSFCDLVLYKIFVTFSNLKKLTFN